MSYSGQARRFRPYAWLGVGALGVGVWAALAGAGVAAADNQTDSSASRATPTASAKTTKSTRPATRGAMARAIAGGFIGQDVTFLVDADYTPNSSMLPLPPGSESWKFDSSPIVPVSIFLPSTISPDISNRPPGLASRAASATASKSPATKSTRPTTRSAKVRAGAAAGVVDLTGGAFTDFSMSPGALDQLASTRPDAAWKFDPTPVPGEYAPPNPQSTSDVPFNMACIHSGCGETR